MISLMTLNDFEYVDKMFKAHLQDSLYCQNKKDFFVLLSWNFNNQQIKSPVKKWM